MKDRLSKLAFIKRLSPAAQAKLVRGARVQRGRAGQILVHAGDAVSNVFVVLEGTLRVYAASAEGREATLYRLGEGEVCLLSLNAAFSDARYPAWVSVESKSAALAMLPGKDLRLLFADDRVIQDMVLRSLTSTVRELLMHLDEALTCRLGERIHRFVLRNCDKHGRINITHQALASHLGVAREAVSREISLLRRQKRLSSGRGFFQLHSAK